MKTIRDRIAEKLAITAAGCWVFAGATTSRGYGSIRIDGDSRSVHVVMYELDNGPVPDGLELDHLCRNRPCCNPAHLEPVTSLENWERGEAPSRINALRTHCVHGHALTGANVRTVHRKGRKPSRACVTCHRQRNRAHMRAARLAA